MSGVGGGGGGGGGGAGKMQIATTQDYGHDSYLTYWFTGALNYQGRAAVAAAAAR